MSAFGGKADTLGMTPNRRVSGRDMEFEKARARHSISNTQSVPVVKAQIYGLTRREHDWLPIHDKLQPAFKYDERAFRIGMVMQAVDYRRFRRHGPCPVSGGPGVSGICPSRVLGTTQHIRVVAGNWDAECLNGRTSYLRKEAI
jgi:hypothetical protein